MYREHIFESREIRRVSRTDIFLFYSISTCIFLLSSGDDEKKKNEKKKNGKRDDFVGAGCIFLKRSKTNCRNHAADRCINHVYPVQKAVRR